VDAAKNVVRLGTGILATALVMTGLMGTDPLAGTRVLAQPSNDISIHRRWLEAVSRGDVDAVLGFLTDDVVFDDGVGCRWPFMCVGPDEVQLQIEASVRNHIEIKITDLRRYLTPRTKWTTAWFEVRSDAVRAAGVERILQAATVVLRGEKIVSVTWRSNSDDEQTKKFLAAQPRPARPSFPRPEPAPSGRFIDVGGRKMYMECLGSGSPTVVFEAGLDPIGGASGKTWVGNEPRPRPNRNIHAQVASVTRACTYDRAGIGLSDRGPIPRDGLRVVGDLHSMLRGAGERPPYVLVGFSLGGPLAYLFASQYRHEVAGLVLLDPTEDFFGFSDRLWAILPQALAETDRRGTEEFYVQVASPQFREGGWDWPATLAHLRGTPPLADIPLIVFSSGVPLTNPYDFAPPSLFSPQAGWPDELVEKWEELFMQVHADLARRVPQGKHVVVDSSHHLMFRFVPDRVTAAVLQVVQMVRAK